MAYLGHEEVVIGGSASPSVTVTVPSGTVVALLLWAGFDSGVALDISSATLNSNAPGETFTCANKAANWTSAGSQKWASPSSGPQTLAVNWNAAPDSNAAFMVYWDGVNTTAHDLDAQGDFGTFPTGATLTLDSASGEPNIVIDASYATPANESGYTSLAVSASGSGGLTARLRWIAASGATVTATTQDPTNFAQIAAVTLVIAAADVLLGQAML